MHNELVNTRTACDQLSREKVIAVNIFLCEHNINNNKINIKNFYAWIKHNYLTVVHKSASRKTIYIQAKHSSKIQRIPPTKKNTIYLSTFIFYSTNPIFKFYI